MGTGRMGTGLARGWIKSGHQVTFGSRDPSGNRAAARPDRRSGIAGYADALSITLTSSGHRRAISAQSWNS